MKESNASEKRKFAFNVLDGNAIRDEARKNLSQNIMSRKVAVKFESAGGIQQPNERNNG